MAAIATETVTQVHHWNESLFSFRTTRDPGFRFENGHFVMLGLEVGGRLPTNTSGGGMSEAYLHGFNLITEAVRQIRGTSTNQVADARWSLATSGEGVPTGALLLRAVDA